MKCEQREKGFTLIEMLVVLVIITLLATLVGPKLFNKVGSSKIKVAAAQIELISSGMDTYRLDVGRFPTTEQGLAALRKAPSGVKHWDGPIPCPKPRAERPHGTTHIITSFPAMTILMPSTHWVAMAKKAARKRIRIKGYSDQLV